MTAQTGGAGLEGVAVRVYRFVNGYWQQVGSDSVSTDVSGDYAVRGLPAGSYRLEFSDRSGEYAPEFYNDAPTVESAQSVILAESGSATVDAALADGATISGRVTAQTGGAGLEGVAVDVYRFANGYWQQVGGNSATSDASGDYVVAGLPGGTYRIGFRDRHGDHAPEFYGDTFVVETAASVTVAEGGNLADIDVALADGATISGRVTAHAGAVGLDGIDVKIYRRNDYQDWDSWENIWSANTYTHGESGDYTLRGLPPGIYRVKFSDQRGTYAGEFYNNGGSFEAGQNLELSEGVKLGGIDVSLADGATISGRVTAMNGGQSLGAVEIEVYRYEASNTSWNWMEPINGISVTDSTGGYSIKGLPAGIYRLLYRDSSGAYAQEYYNDALSIHTAQSVELEEGDQAIDRNVALADGATISGAVRAQQGGAPLEQIQVDLYRYDTRWEHWSPVSMSPEVYTDHAGRYTVRGLPSGSYRIGFRDGSAAFAPEFYGDAWTVETATSVSLPSAGTQLDGIDIALDGAATLQGTVTDSTGAPLEGILVSVYEYDPLTRVLGTSWAVRSAYTDASGNYTLQGLSPRPHRVGFRDPAGAYAQEFYADAPMVGMATVLSLTPGENRTDVDATLDGGASIRGKVTALGSDEALDDIDVVVYRLNTSSQDWEHFWTGAWLSTGANGYYIVTGLPAGKYALEFRDGSRVHASRFYSSNPSVEPASSIEVGAGLAVLDIDVALEPGAAIRGFVHGEDGITPLPNVHVKAYHFIDGQWIEAWQSDYTDASGGFLLNGLAAATYRVGFSDLSGNYADEYYDNVSSLDGATDVPVSRGGTVTLQEVLLDAAVSRSSLAGRITGPDGTTPLANITVTPHRRDETQQTWQRLAPVRSGADGRFETSNLPQGSYLLEFVDGSGAHLSEFYNNAPNKTAAESIDLVPGESVDNLYVSLALSGYEGWKSIHGTVGARENDDDGDGLSNGAEYALGTNPRSPDANTALVSNASGGNLTLEFLKRNQGGTYVLEEMSDLKNGTWLPSQTSVSESPDQSGVGIGYTRMRAVVPATGTRFLRIRATY